MNEKVFEIKFTVDQINCVLQALSAAPYSVAAPVIESIRQQASAQVEAPAAPAVVGQSSED